MEKAFLEDLFAGHGLAISMTTGVGECWCGAWKGALRPVSGPDSHANHLAVVVSKALYEALRDPDLAHELWEASLLDDIWKGDLYRAACAASVVIMNHLDPDESDESDEVAL